MSGNDITILGVFARGVISPTNSSKSDNDEPTGERLPNEWQVRLPQVQLAVLPTGHLFKWNQGKI
ncbi:hypothetical protein [Rhizobium leguminosarum]|uniref:hypothetical protein n=1 Tax=Rhizobium leguminosarum TaxID=384 RepID=UPI0039657015